MSWAARTGRALNARVLGLACGLLLTALLATPATALGLGSFSGKVTAAVGGQPLAGVEVCGESVGVTDIHKCAATDSEGKYRIEGLETGNYKVEFRPSVVSGYLSQFYKDGFGGELVQVVNAADIFGIDAALRREELAGGGGAVPPADPAGGGAPSTTPLPTVAPPPATTPKPPPKSCRKGWRKVRVKGKAVCRKVQRKPRQGSRRR